MSSNWPLRAERSLIVAVFIGGLTIPMLTFLIELKLPLVDTVDLFGYSVGPSNYKELLIIVAGIASSLLILSVFGLKKTIVTKRAKDHWFSVFALASYELGLFAIMAIIPLMVFPFSVSGGYLIVVIEVVWWLVNAIDRFAYGKHKNV
jgi:hypothetical protein